MNRQARIALATVVFVLSLLLIASLGLLPGSAEAQPFAYITNHVGATVSVIDTSSNSVVATIPVGSGPVGVAVSPAAPRVYVANAGAWTGSGFNGNTVSVIDTTSNTVVQTITGVGPGPYGVAINPAGTRVYVTNYAPTATPSTVSVIETSNNTVIATIPVGIFPAGVVVSPDGSVVYVGNRGSNTISVINASTNLVSQTIPATAPGGLALNPSGTRLYVGHYNDGNPTFISIYDTATLAALPSVPVASIPFAVSVNPAGTRLYASNTWSSQVSVIDIGNNTVLPYVNVGSLPHGLALDPTGTRLYVAQAGANSVAVIDTSSNAVIANVPVGNYPVAFGQFIGPDLTPQCVEPPSGLVSWWPGEGNADDIADSNHGTLQGGATFAPGMVGQAFRLDGVDDYINVPHAGNLNLTSFTMLAWVNRQGGWSWGYAGIVTKGLQQNPQWGTWTGPTNYSLLIRDQTTWASNTFYPAMYYRDAAGALQGAETSLGSYLPVGEWHHYAATYDAMTGTVSLYRDGTLLAAGAGTDPASNNEPLRIGMGMQDYALGFRFFNGLIDEVQLYNRALSAAEIQGIYSAGSAGTCKASADATPPTTTATASPGPNPNGWNNTNMTVTLNATDEGGSGVKEIHYALNGSPETVASGSSASITISAEGTTTLTYFAKDNAENQEEPQILTVKIDRTPPSMMGVGTPGPNAVGWNNTDVTVSFACLDSLSGIDSCGPTPQVVTTEGMGQSRTGTAVDKAGNTASTTVSGINIDKTPPTVTYSGNLGNYTVDQTVAITCSASDALSGLASNTCANSNGPAYAFTLGTNSFSASATDLAGNTGSGSTSFTVVVTYESLRNLTRQFVGQRGILNSLEVKLNAAEAAAARGNAQAKAGAIRAFINEVQAQAGKSLTAAQAATLIALAQAL